MGAERGEMREDRCARNDDRAEMREERGNGERIEWRGEGERRKER